VRELARLARAPNLVLAAAGVVTGGWIALERLALPTALAWAALSGAALGAAGNAINDLLDLTADRRNRPERPLPAGRVDRGTAELVVFAGGLVGLAAAGLVSGALVLTAALAFAVMAAYSPLLKRHGWPGNLAVAGVAGLPLFYGALAVGRAPAGVIPWVLAAWVHVVREIVKDLEDEPGDRAAGRRTLPIALGRRPAAVVAAVAALGFVPLSIALPIAAGYGPAYYLIALPAQMAVVVAAVHLLLERWERVSRLLKGVMVVGIVALVAGRAL
jgi:geranylgeranylglycerol-phosphate geranylgeranyltransferase